MGRPAIDIDESIDGDVATVHVAGEIDLATVGRLRDAATTAAEAPVRALVLDLRQVRFMDSTGLTVLIELQEACDRNSQKLEIVYSGDRLGRLFQITGLDRALTLTRVPAPWSETGDVTVERASGDDSVAD